MDVPHKYGLLRVIATILKVLAWIVLGVGIAVAIVALFSIGSASGLTRALSYAGVIGAPLLCIIWFVQLYAFGSVLSLLIDIEESTRAMAVQR
jgi:uncharacterized membrane protein